MTREFPSVACDVDNREQVTALVAAAKEVQYATAHGVGTESQQQTQHALPGHRLFGSSDLSMVRSSPVWPLSVGCEHDAESVVLEVFEAVG